MLVGSAVTTAVAALVIPCGAAAQPPPNAHPTGGVVVGGSASIGQNATTTTVTQSTQRAAVNWQSFDVGSQRAVQVMAPNASAITLMRVVGPDPSRVAGRISSNGIVMITNASGAALDQGAQVNVASFFLFSAGIAPQPFMNSATTMAFDQPTNPNAMVTNAGAITVKGAGVAALMAPAVANGGVITARQGAAWMLGAQAATLTLSGDALVSFRLTKAVSQAPQGVTALISETGIVSASGGTVQIKVDANDGVIQTLSSILGTVTARTVGSHAGTISIGGAGGSINVGGRLQAIGGANQVGGRIGLLASDNVTLSTAATMSASGGAGGGTLAVGTTIKRAAGGPSVTGQPASRTVTVPAGAGLAANATDAGNGGHITVLSTQNTRFGGSAAVRGGPQAGNGGVIELSGAILNMKGATTDVSAPKGQAGKLLLDPRVLIW